MSDQPVFTTEQLQLKNPISVKSFDATRWYSDKKCTFLSRLDGPAVEAQKNKNKRNEYWYKGKLLGESDYADKPRETKYVVEIVISRLIRNETNELSHVRRVSPTEAHTTWFEGVWVEMNKDNVEKIYVMDKKTGKSTCILTRPPRGRQFWFMSKLVDYFENEKMENKPQPSWAESVKSSSKVKLHFHEDSAPDFTAKKLFKGEDGVHIWKEGISKFKVVYVFDGIECAWKVTGSAPDIKKYEEIQERMTTVVDKYIHKCLKDNRVELGKVSNQEVLWKRLNGGYVCQKHLDEGTQARADYPTYIDFLNLVTTAEWTTDREFGVSNHSGPDRITASNTGSWFSDFLTKLKAKLTKNGITGPEIENHLKAVKLDDSKLYIEKCGLFPEKILVWEAFSDSSMKRIKELVEKKNNDWMESLQKAFDSLKAEGSSFGMTLEDGTPENKLYKTFNTADSSIIIKFDGTNYHVIGCLAGKEVFRWCYWSSAMVAEKLDKFRDILESIRKSPYYKDIIDEVEIAHQEEVISSRNGDSVGLNNKRGFSCGVLTTSSSQIFFPLKTVGLPLAVTISTGGNIKEDWGVNYVRFLNSLETLIPGSAIELGKKNGDRATYKVSGDFKSFEIELFEENGRLQVCRPGKDGADVSAQYFLANAPKILSQTMKEKEQMKTTVEVVNGIKVSYIQGRLPGSLVTTTLDGFQVFIFKEDARTVICFNGVEVAHFNMVIGPSENRLPHIKEALESGSDPVKAHLAFIDEMRRDGLTDWKREWGCGFSNTKTGERTEIGFNYTQQHFNNAHGLFILEKSHGSNPVYESWTGWYSTSLIQALQKHDKHVSMEAIDYKTLEIEGVGKLELSVEFAGRRAYLRSIKNLDTEKTHVFDNLLLLSAINEPACVYNELIGKQKSNNGNVVKGVAKVAATVLVGEVLNSLFGLGSKKTKVFKTLAVAKTLLDQQYEEVEVERNQGNERESKW